MLLQIVIVALLFQLLLYRPFATWLFLQIRDTRRRTNYIIIFQRLAIIMLFIASGQAPTGGDRSISFVASINSVQHSIITVAICCLAIGFNFVYLLKNKRSGQWLQLSYAAENATYFFINTATWVVYLISYEYYLRGILLDQLIATFSVSIAITLNVLFYAFLHLQKIREELIGSIPFGILLCWITLYTGSIVPGIAIHVSLALSHDYLSIYFQRKLALKRNKG